MDRKKKERVVALGRSLLPAPIGIDFNVRHMLAAMRQDFVTNVIRTDKTILEYMRRSYHSKGGHQIHKKMKLETTQEK